MRQVDTVTDTSTSDREGGRTPLTRQRVIAGAVDLADRIGIEPLTIRRLASELGTKPMTIYHHVAGKEAILDGMVDQVFGEIEPPPGDLPWRDAIRRRCLSAREVLVRHPWATPLMESRTSPGPETLRHHDAVLGCFRRGGLSLALTAHAYAVVDSYVYGFAIQEASLPATEGEELRELAAAIGEGLAEQGLVHLAELTAEHVARPGYRFGDSFEFGLDLILAGLEERAL
jgi:AcrR family transcriptional regulator